VRNPRIPHSTTRPLNTDQVLLGFHDPRFVPVLLERLKDQHENVRLNAAKWLEEYRDERIVPALIAALKDEACAVQYAAAGSLGKPGDSRARSPVRGGVMLVTVQ
jgi:HEAT repeat protein